MRLQKTIFSYNSGLKKKKTQHNTKLVISNHRYQAFTTSIKNKHLLQNSTGGERERRHPADTGRFCYHLFVKLKTSDKK